MSVMAVERPVQRVIQPGEIVVREQDLAALMASNERMHDALSYIADPEIRGREINAAKCIAVASQALRDEPTVGELPRYVPAPESENVEREEKP